MRTILKYCLILLCWSEIPARADVNSLQLDDLTSTEVRSKIAAGATTILIPIGATEQSGAHLVLGKHNVRARLLAQQIAQKLGNAMVAPVMAYVPEGAISPPAGHMRFAGTISIPEAAFEAVLEGAARSFKQHGFRDIVFLGDHGGYQKNLLRVAQKLKHEWAREPHCHVIAMTDYYRLGSARFAEILKKRGFTDAEIGKHAGLADTALSLALDKNLVRSDALAQMKQSGEADGVVGDPRRATAELGQLAVQEIIDGTVTAIRAEVNAH
ncbi:MAG: creatininase family protein [Pseudomonadota bacterium]